MRDKNLDIYRGLIMMYVIGVIHTLFWLDVSSSVLKSLFLFEMAVVFFITGASYSLSKRRNYVSYILSRMPRVLVPYFVFSMFIIFIQYIAYILGTSITNMPIDKFAYLTIHPMKNADINMPFITWHLWFIPVYLLSIPFIPILFGCFEKLKGVFKLLPLFVIAYLVFLGEKSNISFNMKNLIFYLFWIYSGFFYIKCRNLNVSVVKNVFITLVLLGLLVFIVKSDSYVLNMSKNKFPPNLAFLMFTSTWFSVLYLFRKVFLKIGNLPFVGSIVDIYSNFGFTLYLYQPFTYLLIKPVYVYLSHNLASRCFLTLITIVAVILVNIIFAKAFGRFERVRIKLNPLTKFKKAS